MKKILVAILAIGLMVSPALASNGGGKKKAKKKAKVECKKDSTCDPKDCDPKNCDPKKCDPKTCDLQACPKDDKCTPTATCSGS